MVPTIKYTYTINTANMEVWEMKTHFSSGGLKRSVKFLMAPAKPPLGAPSVLPEVSFFT